MFKSNIKPQKSHLLKKDLEQFDPPPFPGVTINHHTLHRRPVFWRSIRIQHLQQIAPANSARNSALDIFAFDDRRMLFYSPDFFLWTDGFLIGLRGSGTRPYECYENGK